MASLPVKSFLFEDPLTRIFTFLPLREVAGACTRVSTTWRRAYKGLENFIQTNDNIRRAFIPCTSVISYAQSHGFPIYSERTLISLFQRYINACDPAASSRLSIYLPCEKAMISVQRFSPSFEPPSHTNQLIAQLPIAHEKSASTQRTSSVWFLEDGGNFSVCIRIENGTKEKITRLRAIFDQLITQATSGTSNEADLAINTLHDKRSLQIAIPKRTGPQPKHILVAALILVICCSILLHVGQTASSATNPLAFSLN